jgi:hypothetical protein
VAIDESLQDRCRIVAAAVQDACSMVVHGIGAGSGEIVGTIEEHGLGYGREMGADLSGLAVEGDVERKSLENALGGDCGGLANDPWPGGGGKG